MAARSSRSARSTALRCRLRPGIPPAPTERLRQTRDEDLFVLTLPEHEIPGPCRGFELAHDRFEDRHARQRSAEPNLERRDPIARPFIRREPRHIADAETAHDGSSDTSFAVGNRDRVAAALHPPARPARQQRRYEARCRQAASQHEGGDVAVEQRAVEEEPHQWWPADASSGSSRPLWARAALRSSISRSRPASFALSQRATSTGWVFEARSSHQPSGVLTRTPSMSFTLAFAAFSRAFTSSTTVNLRSSAQSNRSSGVFTSCGSLSRIAARLSLALDTMFRSRRPQ